MYLLVFPDQVWQLYKVIPQAAEIVFQLIVPNTSIIRIKFIQGEGDFTLVDQLVQPGSPSPLADPRSEHWHIQICPPRRNNGKAPKPSQHYNLIDLCFAFYADCIQRSPIEDEVENVDHGLADMLGRKPSWVLSSSSATRHLVHGLLQLLVSPVPTQLTTKVE